MVDCYGIFDGAKLIGKTYAHKMNIDANGGGVLFYIGDQISGYVPRGYIILRIKDPNNHTADKNIEE